MAASMSRINLVCGNWIKIGRFYYCSQNGMTYSMQRNSRSSIACTKTEQPLKYEKKWFSSKRNVGVYICDLGYGGMNRTCTKAKMLHSHSFETHPCINYHRQYSEDKGLPKKTLPSLMDFPEIVWPSVIKTLRNWILANLIITPYFDQEFRLADFVSGSKKAVEVVSGCLSSGDYTSLAEFVTAEALEELKKNVATFSLQQRQELAISYEDIYFSFPYQIGVMFNGDDKNQQRFVEITMCYHVLRGLKELTQQGVTPPLNMGMMPEYRDKIFIFNYRFIREFTKGVEDQWTVNVVNHFKPSDYVS